jgi:PBP1b-binding outer membrane lipoprotein LpoB
MHLFKYLVSLCFIILFFAGCSEDTPLQSPPPATKLSTFSEIQREVFNPSCAVSGCHAGATVPISGNLDLTAPNAYNQLVDQTSLLDPSKKRVDPNSSDESVLVLILRGSVIPRMPYGQPPLSAATIDSIAKWIDEGAQDN